MKDMSQNSLDEQLANLARNVPPVRNLWPGIASRLERRARRGRPLALAAAAAVVGACLASMLTWALLHGRAQAPATLAAAPAPSFEESRDPHYLAARDSLEQTFQERVALLDPRTREQIQSSLAVIRKAHEDIRKALAADPASPVLEQLWESTWHDEFDLYDRVVRSTQPTMTRT